MTDITFFSPGSFDGGAVGAPQDWRTAILGSAGSYRVESISGAEAVLVASTTSSLPGFRLALHSPVGFTAAPGGLITGVVDGVELYDAGGRLVLTVANLPAGLTFDALSDNARVAGTATYGDFTGSPGADSIGGFAIPDLIDGQAGDDILQGGPGLGTDLLIGGPGADTLIGGGGDDTIVAGDGADFVDAGSGNDVVDLSEATGVVEAWLDQAAPAGRLRVDNAEYVVLSAFGGRIHGGAANDIIAGEAGRDEFDGSAGDDVLVGFGGDDILRGGAGDDVLAPGDGDDLVDGGPGLDAVSYFGARGGVSVDLRLTTAQDTGEGRDTLIDVEDVYGSSAGSDTLTGSAAANLFATYGGSNRLMGLEGNDVAYTGRGNDTFSGGAGNDTVDDAAGSNYLRGDEGDDYLYGGAGFDDINGNMGSDTVDGYDGDDWAVGGKDNDLLFGGAGSDLVYGNLGDDTCYGGEDADIVRGGQGNDTISGGAGSDFVSGDRGDDTIAGGTGADVFHGSQDAGLDRVVDFNMAEGDRVMLDPGTTYTLRQDGADTIIDMGGPNQVVLVGVSLASLPANWIFGA